MQDDEWFRQGREGEKLKAYINKKRAEGLA